MHGLLLLFLGLVNSEAIFDNTGIFSYNNECYCPETNSTTKCDATGQCECFVGSWGQRCQHNCECENDQGICDLYDGHCECIFNFTSPECESYGCNCQSSGTRYCVTRKCHCKDGYYGPTCNHRCYCHINSLKLGCDINGQCACQAGFYGIKCEKSCNCSKNAVHSICDDSGLCECRNGFYGEVCEKTCRCNRNGSYLNICTKSGNCICRPGYTGEKCDKKCQCHSRYSLQPNCDPFGVCVCKQNYYGKRCYSQCYCHNAVPNTTCDHLGNCYCQPNYIGKNCIRECNCGNISNYCDHRGYCVCPSGYYGNGCQQSCTHCHMENSLMNCDYNGYCECKPGFYGHNCSSSIFVCGRTHLNELFTRKQSRIVNPLYVDHPIPWSVRILLRNKHVCSGVILNEYWVLTLVRCFTKTEEASDILVLVGDFSITRRDASEQMYSVVEMYVPTRQNRRYEDLALLKIKTNDNQGIRFSSTSQPICLMSTPTTQTNPTIYYVGWGYTNNNVPGSVVQTARFKVFSNEKCFTLTKIRLSDTLICGAGSNVTNEFACFNEIGGALIKIVQGTHYLIGLLVKGSQNCREHSLSLFTDINKYIEWISSIITYR